MSPSKTVFMGSALFQLPSVIIQGFDNTDLWKKERRGFEDKGLGEIGRTGREMEAQV